MSLLWTIQPTGAHWKKIFVNEHQIKINRYWIGYVFECGCWIFWPAFGCFTLQMLVKFWYLHYRTKRFFSKTWRYGTLSIHITATYKSFACRSTTSSTPTTTRWRPSWPWSTSSAWTGTQSFPSLSWSQMMTFTSTFHFSLSFFLPVNNSGENLFNGRLNSDLSLSLSLSLCACVLACVLLFNKLSFVDRRA